VEQAVSWADRLHLLRLRGDYLWFLIGISAIVIAVGLFGGFSGLL